MANVRMKIESGVEVGKTDISFTASDDDGIIGTLTLSKGTLDWRSKGRKSGGGGECRLKWKELDRLLRDYESGKRK